MTLKTFGTPEWGNGWMVYISHLRQCCTQPSAVPLFRTPSLQRPPTHRLPLLPPLPPTPSSLLLLLLNHYRFLLRGCRCMVGEGCVGVIGTVSPLMILRTV